MILAGKIVTIDEAPRGERNKEVIFGRKKYMKQIIRKISAILLAACLLLGTAFAESGAADLEALYPLMDLVSAACLDAQGDDEYALVIPDSEGVLTEQFVASFVRIGQTYGQNLGITPEMMEDTKARMELLSTIFDAQIPETGAILPEEGGISYIGFYPANVYNVDENGTIQIVGMIYVAPAPIDQLSGTLLNEVSWWDRGIFTFQADERALNGYRLMGFSSGMDLNMEEAFMQYDADIIQEYVDTNLGYRLCYPTIFADDVLVEDESGVKAEMPDGSASFFARRIDNADGSDLESYVNLIASGLNGAKVTISEYNATILYTKDNYTVFDVYIVTESYIYQAELQFLTEMSSEFGMYCNFLENSFGTDEGAQG